MTIYLQVYMRYTRYMRATFQLIVATFVSSSGKLRCFKIMHAYKYKRRAGGCGLDELVAKSCLGQLHGRPTTTI